MTTSILPALGSPSPIGWSELSELLRGAVTLSRFLHRSNPLGHGLVTMVVISIAQGALPGAARKSTLPLQVDAPSGARGCCWRQVQDSHPALSRASVGRTPEN